MFDCERENRRSDVELSGFIRLGFSGGPGVGARVSVIKAL